MQACVYTSAPFEETETLAGEAHEESTRKKKREEKKRLKRHRSQSAANFCARTFQGFSFFFVVVVVVAKGFFRTKVGEHNGPVDGPFVAGEFPHEHSGGSAELLKVLHSQQTVFMGKQTFVAKTGGDNAYCPHGVWFHS